MSEWRSFKQALSSTFKNKKVSPKLGGTFLAFLSFLFASILSSFQRLFRNSFRAINHLFPIPGFALK
jgi:hypothetical protein